MRGVERGVEKTHYDCANRRDLQAEPPSPTAHRISSASRLRSIALPISIYPTAGKARRVRKGSAGSTRCRRWKHACSALAPIDRTSAGTWIRQVRGHEQPHGGAAHRWLGALAIPMTTRMWPPAPNPGSSRPQCSEGEVVHGGSINVQPGVILTSSSLPGRCGSPLLRARARSRRCVCSVLLLYLPPLTPDCLLLYVSPTY